LDALVNDPTLASGLRANLEVVHTLNMQITRLEHEVLSQVKLAAQFEPLLSMRGHWQDSSVEHHARDR
ncbi:MAG: hypothetical protein ABI612_17880, partial [Betaproteobacteria bacterium]